MDTNELANLLRWFKNDNASPYDVAEAIEKLIAKMIEEAKHE